MQLPNYSQTSIRSAMFFSFLLPVTAFGFEDDMVMEISVDYFLSDDKTKYYANVWARQDRAMTKGFITTTTVPVCDDPEITIFETLNHDERFNGTMSEFICLAAKNRCD